MNKVVGKSIWYYYLRSAPPLKMKKGDWQLFSNSLENNVDYTFACSDIIKLLTTTLIKQFHLICVYIDLILVTNYYRGLQVF
jgi:hypothetical protein